MTTIISLPNELLAEACTYLEPDDLGNLRLTCKRLHDHLQRYFGSLFTTRRIMVEHECLEALVNISRHPVLSGHMREVRIDAQVFPESAYWNSAMKISDEFHLGRLLRGHLPREVLISTGQAHSMLVEVFKNLINLEKVYVENGSTRLWGWSYSTIVVSHLSENRRLANDSRPWLLLPIVVAALAEARARPKTLKLLLSKTSPQSFMIPKNSKIEGMLNKLDELEVVLQVSREWWADVHRGIEASRSIGILLARVKAFMLQLTSLTSLTLKFKHQEPLATKFLAWLAGSSDDMTDLLPSYYTQHVEFKTLTSLHIAKATVPTDVLLAVCIRFHLNYLGFSDVSIKRERPRDDTENCWRLFLWKLGEALESRRLIILRIWEASQYIQDGRVPSTYPGIVGWPVSSTNMGGKMLWYSDNNTSETISEFLKRMSSVTTVVYEVD